MPLGAHTPWLTGSAPDLYRIPMMETGEAFPPLCQRGKLRPREGGEIVISGISGPTPPSCQHWNKGGCGDVNYLPGD